MAQNHVNYTQILIHTIGPANNEVPESAIAAHPLAQNPEKESQQLGRKTIDDQLHSVTP